MTISPGGQQEVDGVPLLINVAVPIPVLTTELDVRLIEAPTLAARADGAFPLPFPEGDLQHRQQLNDLAVNGEMIDEHAAFLDHLFQIVQIQGVGDVPSHAEQHDVQERAPTPDHAAEAVHDSRCARLIDKQIGCTPCLIAIERAEAPATSVSSTMRCFSASVWIR